MNLMELVGFYKARQARTLHPDGTFDDKKRWYPSESERRDCCALIRRPTARFPYSLMTHCRSAYHIALLHGVDAKELSRAIKLVSRFEFEPELFPIDLYSADLFKRLMSAVKADERIQDRRIPLKKVIALARQISEEKDIDNLRQAC